MPLSVTFAFQYIFFSPPYNLSVLRFDFTSQILMVKSYIYNEQQFHRVTEFPSQSGRKSVSEEAMDVIIFDESIYVNCQINIFCILQYFSSTLSL